MSKRKREPNFEQWDVIEVHWVDSERTDGWRFTRDHQPPKSLACRTVGMFYLADADSLTLVLSAADVDSTDEQYCGSITIPRVAVLAVAKVRP